MGVCNCELFYISRDLLLLTFPIKISFKIFLYKILHFQAIADITIGSAAIIQLCTIGSALQDKLPAALKACPKDAAVLASDALWLKGKCPGKCMPFKTSCQLLQRFVMQIQLSSLVTPCGSKKFPGKDLFCMISRHQF